MIDKDELFTRIQCALAHDTIVCEDCGKCDGNNRADIRLIMVDQLRRVLEEDKQEIRILDKALSLSVMYPKYCGADLCGSQGLDKKECYHCRITNFKEMAKEIIETNELGKEGYHGL